MGPVLSPKPPDCAIEIIAEGGKPMHPYRDVGMVALGNCPDFRTRPCLDWLRKEACELGGQLAYQYEEVRPQSDIANPINYKVMVAVYVSDLPQSFDNDSVYKALACEPACGEKEKCRDGKCVPLSDEDCEKAALEKEEEKKEEAVRCLE